MSISTDIRAALQGRLLTVPGLPAARAWESVRFEPVPGTPYVDASLGFGRRRPITLGTAPTYEHSGLFLVTLALASGAGPEPGDQLADAVIAHFPAGLHIPYNGVIVRIWYAERTRGIDDAGWRRVPVTVAWRVTSATP